MARPIAFMVMPFDVKKTERTDAGVPPQVDFDALWEKVHQPVLEELGYRAVRADRDVGALIIKEMIERLAIADLVVADITIANANVYYEVGIRHAARRAGCVLVSAEWTRPVFDLAQMRQLRFPLTEGNVTDATAAEAKAALAKGLAALAAGDSPVFQAVPGFPDDIDQAGLAAFQDAVGELSRFEAAVRRVRAAPEEQRRKLALDVRDEYGGSAVVRQAVVLELVRLLRDEVDWDALLEYVDTLPANVVKHPLVLEQRALALAKTGDPLTAVGDLETLVAAQGENAERLGLIGGRYKELMRSATSERDRRRYLDRAIEYYERGMLRDLNSYYPASNLPRLYRARGDEGDDQRAADAQAATALACRAAVESGIADEWARPTLLGVAFGRGDVPETRRLLGEVRREGAVAWMLATTIADLADSAAQHADATVREGLEAVLEALTELLPEPEPAKP